MNRKNLFLLLLTLTMIGNSQAQTLFTYGPYTADAGEFLRAFNKNNMNTQVPRAQAMREYLELYIKSKLKVREALERRYDTLPAIRAEVENLRAQIVETFLTDPEIINRLQKEAFQRSLKQIHTAHIFIAFRNTAGQVDTIAAAKKKDEVLQRLKNGADFFALAREISDDPAVKTNGGDIGYITVFTLAYPFENALYAAAPGKITEAIRSKIGYHIFKNIEERKNPGKLKVRQILLAFPPDATETIKKQLAARADSLYKRLQAGDKFASLANTFSNDYVSAANGGLLPDIGVGQYDPLFEKQVWALTKDGAFSKPFLTTHGWHIVLRESLKPPVTDAANKDFQQELQQKIIGDSRWKASKEHIYKQVRDKAGLTMLLNDDAAFRAFSDSLLDRMPLQPAGKGLARSTPVFTIGNDVYDFNAWYLFASANRFRADGSGTKPFEQVKEEWLQYAMFDYYKRNLEEFNPEFRSQMNEFRDGNLFFEIMQQEVWTKAQQDTMALRTLYEQNKKQYTWQRSADVVIFFCSDAGIAQTLYDKVKAKPADWRAIAELYSDKALPDSARYEWNQIPGLNKQTPKAGMMTTPQINETDNTASFAYIFNAYPQVLQRSYTEAKGMVINDYQTILEKQWEASLRKKYPVQVDEKVLAELAK